MWLVATKLDNNVKYLLLAKFSYFIFLSKVLKLLKLLNFLASMKLP